jgi:VWFA-related protein
MSRRSSLLAIAAAKTRPVLVGVVGTCLAVITLVAEQKPSPLPRTAFVELDAVVVDHHDQPVRGMHQEDFEIKEDGDAVAVTSFTEVSAAGISSSGDSRSVVLLLDDTRVSPIATTLVQYIARLFLSRARAADAVAVVRLTHHEDEAIGLLPIALDRIDQYRAKTLPYFGLESIEDALKALTKISKQLEPIAHRRTAVVCIGGRSICDPFFAEPKYSLVWPYWRDALSATARANVSVYLVDPAGVTGSLDLGYGLVDHTGGAAFVLSNKFTRAVDAIWEEAGHYYLLGYRPTARPRDLHSIDVKVKQRGLRVRARLNRGD